MNTTATYVELERDLGKLASASRVSCCGPLPNLKRSDELLFGAVSVVLGTACVFASIYLYKAVANDIPGTWLVAGILTGLACIGVAVFGLAGFFLNVIGFTGLAEAAKKPKQRPEAQPIFRDPGEVEVADFLKRRRQVFINMTKPSTEDWSSAEHWNFMEIPAGERKRLNEVWKAVTSHIQHRSPTISRSLGHFRFLGVCGEFAVIGIDNWELARRNSVMFERQILMQQTWTMFGGGDLMLVFVSESKIDC